MLNDVTRLHALLFPQIRRFRWHWLKRYVREQSARIDARDRDNASARSKGRLIYALANPRKLQYANLFEAQLR